MDHVATLEQLLERYHEVGGSAVVGAAQDAHDLLMIVNVKDGRSWTDDETRQAINACCHLRNAIAFRQNEVQRKA